MALPDDEYQSARRTVQPATPFDLWRQAGLDPDDPDDRRKLVAVLRQNIERYERDIGRRAWWSKMTIILITAIVGVAATLGARWIP